MACEKGWSSVVSRLSAGCHSPAAMCGGLWGHVSLQHLQTRGTPCPLSIHPMGTAVVECGNSPSPSFWSLVLQAFVVFCSSALSSYLIHP